MTKAGRTPKLSGDQRTTSARRPGASPNVVGYPVGDRRLDGVLRKVAKHPVIVVIVRARFRVIVPVEVRRAEPPGQPVPSSVPRHLHRVGELPGLADGLADSAHAL